MAHRTLVIWRLEAAQMLRPGSLLWAGALAALPAALMTVVRALAPQAVETEGVIEFWMYLLIPNLVCLLGLLLTATSAIHSEIENRTWVYLAVRPGAKLAALAGKYLFAVSWVFAIALAATLFAALSLWGVVTAATALRTVALSLLACFGYGALYLLIGVAFLRIGMVVAIAYTLFVEVLVGNLPAVVNRATISFHIRAVFLGWIPEGSLPEELMDVFGAGVGPAAVHVAVLGGVTVLLLLAAAAILSARQVAVGDAD